MAFSVNFKDFEKECDKNWEHGSPTHNHVKVFTKIKLALSVVMSQPHFEGVVMSPLTLPKMGLGSPPGLPKT
jgi:hypothetical protein